MKTKKFVLFLVFSLFTFGAILNGCSDSISKEEEFEELLSDASLDDADIVMVEKTFVPDSLRPALAIWITETVRAASYYLTTCDYEHPEDVIEQLEKTGNKVFTRTFKYEGLRMFESRRDTREVVYEDLTPSQKKIFDYLKNKKMKEK